MNKEGVGNKVNLLSKTEVEQELGKKDEQLLKDNGLDKGILTLYVRLKRSILCDSGLLLVWLFLGATIFAFTVVFGIIANTMLFATIHLLLWIAVTIISLFSIGIEKVLYKYIQKNNKKEYSEFEQLKETMVLQKGIYELSKIAEEDINKSELSYLEKRPVKKGNKIIKSDVYQQLTKKDLMLLLQEMSKEDVLESIEENKTILIDTEDKQKKDTIIELKIPLLERSIYFEQNYTKGENGITIKNI